MSVSVVPYSIRRWRRGPNHSPHHVGASGREIPSDGIPAHTQLPGGASYGHAPVSSVVDCVPPGPLTSVGLVPWSDHGLVSPTVREVRLTGRCRLAVSPVGYRSAESTVRDAGPEGAASEDPGFRGSLLRRDDVSLVEHPQAAVQSFKHLNPGSSVARMSIVRRQLQSVPAVPQRVVPGHLPGVLVAEDPVEVGVGPRPAPRLQSCTCGGGGLVNSRAMCSWPSPIT